LDDVRIWLYRICDCNPIERSLKRNLSHVEVRLLGSHVVHSAVKIEAIGYSESLAPLCQVTRCHISEVSNIHTRRSENLKSDMARPLAVYHTQGLTYPQQQVCRNRKFVCQSRAASEYDTPVLRNPKVNH
jgi:hypothetical protein